MTKFLVIAPSWIGDTIIAQSLFMRLLERNPNSSIDVYAPKWVAPVLIRMPQVNKVIDNPFPHGELNLLKRRQQGIALKKGNYDHVIVLPNSLKSALVPFFAKIPMRTGFIGEMRYGLLNDARKLNKKELPLMVERYAILAEKANQPLQRPVPEPRLKPVTENIPTILERLDLTLENPVIIFCPGAEYGPAKRWPTEHFAALASMYKKDGYQIWLFGSNKDKPVCEEINRLSDNICEDLSGKTDLGEVIDLISCATKVVSNDSGLMHVAAAMDKPMAALFGSSSPEHTPPLSNHAKVISLNLECSPCFQRECPLGHFNCMRKLFPENVYNTLHNLNDAKKPTYPISAEFR